MIFLSVQPDEYYFIWQLELQLYNFGKLGIPAGNIHILVGFNPRRGLEHHFREFMEKNKDKACIFAYPDNRERRKYDPSIRPHLIQQHLIANPTIQQECIFYHDADIIFRDLPDFEEMLKDDVWYMSDTGSYTGSAFLLQNGGEANFKRMCAVVGIDPEVVVANDQHCGGAQYLLKGTTIAFWAKVEADCEAMFMVMGDHNKRQSQLFYERYGQPQQSFVGVQAWCADMWVVFWNALLEGQKVRLHPEMNFLISKSPIEEWETTKILHYSGEATNAKGAVFRKIKYIHSAPYYDRELDVEDFSKTASLPLVRLIKEYRAELDEQRIDLLDVTFIIPVRIDSDSRLLNLYIVTACLNKYFKTQILILESDTHSRIDKMRLPECCRCLFMEDNDRLLHRTRLNNAGIRMAATDIVAIYDTDVILPVRQIVESVNGIRSKKAAMVSPYGGDFLGVSNVFKTMMEKLLDPDLLTLNAEKFPVVTRRSYGGAAFLERNAYMAAGMENEHFSSWGPEDIERPKRMRNLGYRVGRVDGSLFHLPHDRNVNSGYLCNDQYVTFIEEYLKVADMNKRELELYIGTWEWV